MFLVGLQIKKNNFPTALHSPTFQVIICNRPCKGRIHFLESVFWAESKKQRHQNKEINFCQGVPEKLQLNELMQSQPGLRGGKRGEFSLLPNLGGGGDGVKHSSNSSGWKSKITDKAQARRVLPGSSSTDVS